MKFTINKHDSVPVRDIVAESAIDSFLCHGDEFSSDPSEVNFVLNLTDIEHPQVYRRRSQNVFVISFVDGHSLNGNLRSECYRTLVQSLSNLLVCVYPTSRGTELYFTTPEAGFYHVEYSKEALYQRLLPIATAHFATDNIFSTDLPPKYLNSSPVVEQLRHFGKVLDELHVLPTPFPLRELLPETELRHIYKIYGITGASYGNLSAREDVPALGETAFWMTGRGVNKAHLTTVGKDILLVKDFDLENGTALVSVPADYERTARVSVDAIEHYQIYRAYPRVGAIIHVHAWIEGVHCTRQNYPCGTRELANEVVALLGETDNPSCTAVGLKNHGLTITGPSLDEIFSRVGSQLQTEVPMFA